MHERVRRLHARGVAPKCRVFVMPNDADGLFYARAASKTAQRVQVELEIVQLDAGTDTQSIARAIAHASADDLVHGILLQRPLSGYIDEAAVCQSIAPSKDVDCAHPLNYGLLSLGKAAFPPATAAAVLQLLQEPEQPALEGAHAVVVGRSRVVGQPIALLLSGANATITLCHSRTKNLAQLCRSADVLVAAVGKAGFVGADMVKGGATVIDVGTNLIAGTVTGDVDAAVVAPIAGVLSPVPGGVGPVTTAMLLRNVVRAAEQAN